MPLYEYACRTCGHHFEKLVRTFDAPASIDCPECKSGETGRELSVFAVGADGAKATPVAAGCGRCGGPNACGMD